MLVLPAAGVGLVVVLVVEWAVGNVVAAPYLGVRPGWDELAAVVPIMVTFAAVETVLAVAAHRRGYGVVWLLFALPGAAALVAAAVWLAGGVADGLGAPMWRLTAGFGGLNLVLLLLAVRTLRRALRVDRPAARGR